MKKIIPFLLIIVMLFCFVCCNKSNTTSPLEPTPSPTPIDPIKAAAMDKYQPALQNLGNRIKTKGKVNKTSNNGDINNPVVTVKEYYLSDFKYSLTSDGNLEYICFDPDYTTDSQRLRDGTTVYDTKSYYMYMYPSGKIKIDIYYKNGLLEYLNKTQYEYTYDDKQTASLTLDFWSYTKDVYPHIDSYDGSASTDNRDMIKDDIDFLLDTLDKELSEKFNMKLSDLGFAFKQ